MSKPFFTKEPPMIRTNPPVWVKNRLSRWPIVISSSYGNDSVALIQWAKDRGLNDVKVIFVNTGWCSRDWIPRVQEMEKWVTSIGYEPIHVNPLIQFESLIRHKQGFPNNRYQWCSLHLKVLPFLEYMDKKDSSCKSVVLIGKRREESHGRADTPEFIKRSEYHGDRMVWHPLYAHFEADRDLLLNKAGFEPLPHRSMECCPCVNANKEDLMLCSEYEIERVERLEQQVGKLMFRPKGHMGAKGIREIIKWANSGRGEYEPPTGTCTSGYCGI